MRQFAFTVILCGALATAAFAQGMGGSTSSDSKMTPPNAMSNSNAMTGENAMMAQDMSYEALKKKGMLADTRMGMELRMAPSTGMKVAYKDLMSTQKLAAKNPTVLFFAADWCPNCQADLKDINANGSRLGSINVVVVDYDKNVDLRKKYGVTAQDTFVQIGPMGEKLAIWNGGGVQGIVDKTHQAM